MGQAVTCDDFVQAMEDASGADLSQFRLWYSQAGTPEVTFDGAYDQSTQTYSVKLKQHIPDTPKQTNKEPMVIPIALGLISPDGKDLIDTEILNFTEKEQKFSFSNINVRPVPSVLRGFSAPVKLTTNLTDEDYIFLTKNETYDGFNRWEAGQHLARKVLCEMLDQYENGQKLDVPQTFVDGYDDLLSDALDETSDKALLARAITLPDVSALIQERNSADPEAIFKARENVLAAIKRTHKKQLEKVYKANAPSGTFEITSEAMAKRALRNVTLMLLTATHGTGCAKRAKEHYFTADNMTDRVAALSSLASNKNEERDEIFADFYKRYKDYPLVIDKWFALQASSTLPNTVEKLTALKKHKDFNIKNPNRARSLFAAFAMNNPARFHAADGSGYVFLRDAVIELNAINPQIAARLLIPMREWRRYTSDRQELMKQALANILEIKDIAPDVFEIASKSLNG